MIKLFIQLSVLLLLFVPTPKKTALPPIASDIGKDLTERLIPHQDSTEAERIAAAARAFSAAYMREDVEAMMDYYTEDAAIFPTQGDILDTPVAIAKYWTVPEGIDVLHHESISENLQIVGNTAYDYGYYQGRINRRGEESEFQGKYVIVWEKGGDGQWRMKVDIWNRR